METLGLPRNIVIFDAEYTTWEGAMERNWSGPGEHRETIQIGAVRIQGAMVQTGQFSCIVRPTINPILSEYCTEVTGITQEMVDKGLDYADALACFASWSADFPLYSWGSDLSVMKLNADLVKIRFPIDMERSHDVRDVFRKNGIDTSGYMSSTIPRAFGEESPYRAHDGLNDARSIFQALRALRLTIA